MLVGVATNRVVDLGESSDGTAHALQTLAVTVRERLRRVPYSETVISTGCVDAREGC